MVNCFREEGTRVGGWGEEGGGNIVFVTSHVLFAWLVPAWTYKMVDCSGSFLQGSRRDQKIKRS